MTPRQHRSLQAAVTGPGRGPNAAARNAIYATCPKPVRLLMAFTCTRTASGSASDLTVRTAL